MASPMLPRVMRPAAWSRLRRCGPGALSLLLLGPALFLIAKALLQSWLHGDWPFTHYGDWSLVHGPWRYGFGVIERLWRHDLSRGIGLVMAAVLVSAGALIIKPDRRSVLLFLASGVAFWVSMRYLYWIID